MKYYVTLAGREYEVELDGDSVRVDGTCLRAELRELPETPLKVFGVDGRTLVLAARALARGEWELLHRGEAVRAEVLDERLRHIRRMIGAGKANAPAGVLRSPMPGLVVRVLVEAGQLVAAGAGLVVLEAMKMENELKAPAPGLVDRVLVSPGQAVEKGQPLVLLGPVPGVATPGPG